MKKQVLNALASGMMAFVATTAFASVTPAGLERIHSGMYVGQVLELLGKPEAKPVWMNGTYSLTYRVSNDGNSSERAYIDIDRITGKVVGMTVDPNLE